MSQKNDQPSNNNSGENLSSSILVNSEDIRLARTSSQSNALRRNTSFTTNEKQNVENPNFKSSQLSPNKNVNSITKDLNSLQAKTYLNANNTTNSSYNTTSILSEYIKRHNTLSAVEAAILRSTVPIDINDVEEINIHGQRGIWANKSESMNWKGSIPLSNYSINEDANPEIITKKSNQQVIYQQEVAIRYLRPPTPPSPGEIIIQQQVNTLGTPAPPLVIRQQPPR